MYRFDAVLIANLGADMSGCECVCWFQAIYILFDFYLFLAILVKLSDYLILSMKRFDQNLRIWNGCE